MAAFICAASAHPYAGHAVPLEVDPAFTADSPRLLQSVRMTAGTKLTSLTSLSW